MAMVIAVKVHRSKSWLVLKIVLSVPKNLQSTAIPRGSLSVDDPMMCANGDHVRSRVVEDVVERWYA